MNCLRLCLLCILALRYGIPWQNVPDRAVYETHPANGLLSIPQSEKHLKERSNAKAEIKFRAAGKRRVENVGGAQWLPAARAANLGFRGLRMESCADKLARQVSCQGPNSLPHRAPRPSKMTFIEYSRINRSRLSDMCLM
jgi:hypothetical protein